MPSLKYTGWYFLKSIQVAFTQPEPFTFLQNSLRQYSFWISTIKKYPLEVGYPWIAISAIDRLKEILTPTSRVFEYSSGGSTVFFINHAQSVVSVESDPKWSEAVKKTLAHFPPDKFVYHFQAPISTDINSIDDCNDPSLFLSSRPQYRNVSFEKYVRAIDDYEDNSFDLVVVDGYSRPSCIKHAIPKVRPGGYLMLDNSSRSEYISGKAMLQNWQLETYYSPVTYSIVPLFDETSIWQKPIS